LAKLQESFVCPPILHRLERKEHVFLSKKRGAGTKMKIVNWAIFHPEEMQFTFEIKYGRLVGIYGLTINKTNETSMV
jgi:hypothetical protein